MKKSTLQNIDKLAEIQKALEVINPALAKRINLTDACELMVKFNEWETAKVEKYNGVFLESWPS